MTFKSSMTFKPKSIPNSHITQTWETYVIDTLQIYNIINNEWSYGKSIPKNGIKLNGIESASCITDTIQENIYVFGGMDDFTNATKTIFKYNIQNNDWIKLQSELLEGEYESRTILNPYTNDIYIIGHNQNTAIDIQIFSQKTETIKSNPILFNTFIGGSSNEIYNHLLLSIGGHNTLTESYNTIKYALFLIHQILI